MFCRKRPKFAVDEMVKILPKEKITKTLNSEHKLDGCLFMDKMSEYCGREFKVVKAMGHFYNNDRMLK